MRPFQVFSACLVAAASLALIAHAQTPAAKPMAAQPIRQAAPAPATTPAAPPGPSLEQQVADLRAQLDALRKVIEVDASGNVVVRANRDLVLKAGNTIDAYATNDAKLRGKKVELEGEQETKVRGKHVRLDSSSDMDVRGGGSVRLRSEGSFDAEGKALMNLRSSGIIDARASLIKLN